ncbi:ribosome biosynthesis protein NSA1 NDAI_0F01980 [Naumovozyma dairenensis CBS 421]|uniref:Ribosome biogenesis protein NSA1 n=1 Tax=Naumovozyma dairenensis (strain ATCC 10597 / BCRC 20456 / CBS 421 / NBRC 0211 / NRRL Y-12639) TaxID=1071378 RepID=G0WCK5_NAUDC|nr:hypothetical protein NDAI_0F01980 [Naumovozyma dairenensis CBS 421]CCD25516.1 hypothetical protein NDAI_0F01980 [Naumovozyma dairenensis CBS 421]
MRLLVSCVDSGSIKEIVCNQGTDTSIQTSIQPFHISTNLSQGSSNAIDQIAQVTTKTLLLARCNGAIELVQTVGKTMNLENDISFETNDYEILDKIEGLTDDSKLAPLYEKSKKRTKLRDGTISLSLVKKYKKIVTYISATKSGMVHIIDIENNRKLVLKNTFQLKAPLDFLQLYDFYEVEKPQEKYVFAYGGEENLIKLVEINSNFTEIKQIWEAKNVKNDTLDLRVPVWPIGVKFLRPFEKEGSDFKNQLNYQFLAVTHWSHLGKYRTVHGRKPMEYIDLLPDREPLTSFILSGNDLSRLGNLQSSDFADAKFFISDTKKNVFQFNSTGRLLKKFGKGEITGASSYINVYGNKYLLQGGLDRYVRVFDLQHGNSLSKVYLGGKINFITVLDTDEVVVPVKEDAKSKKAKKRKMLEEETEQDADKLWDQLDTSSKKSKV